MVLKKQEIEADVLTLARERISRTYDLYDRVCVFFSGGKDSTVCLELTLEEAEKRGALPLDVVFFDEEAIHPETIDYVRRRYNDPRVAMRWMCVPIKHRNACSREEPWWYPWAPEDKEKWCRPLPPEATTELPGHQRETVPESNKFLFHREDGTVGIVVGLRAAESLRRYRAVAQREHDNFLSQDPHAKHIFLSKPIYDWSDMDVWTAPKHFGWDYNRAYDVLQAAGVSLTDQRVCPPYGEEPLRGLWQYAQCWPELWDRMVSRVPGAATAARYSRSPLYSFGSRLLREGDPREQIQEAIALWPEESQKLLRERLRKEIAQHQRKQPGTPIPRTEPGSSGITWEFLLKIAVRGDFKGRRTANYSKDAEDAGRY